MHPENQQPLEQPIQDPWILLHQWVLQQTPSRCFQPPLPSDLPDNIDDACSDSFARGIQASSNDNITGPQIPNNASRNQRKTLRWYYQLGLQQKLLSIPTPTSSTQPEPQSVTTAPPRPRVPKVADPEFFRGKRAEFENFTTQLQLKFMSDPSAFATEQSKIVYAGSYLRDAAYTWFKSYVSFDGSVSFNAYAEFYKALQQAFDDPDSYATAERTIKNLRQESSCSDYYSRFVSLISILGWNQDSVQISLFKEGLKDSVKDLLIGRELPQKFQEFANLCINLDCSLYARYLEKKRATKAPGSPSIPVPAPTPAPRSVAMSPNTLQTTQPTTEPMELDHAARKAYRQANNLCTYCGASGHWVKQCPKAAAKNKAIQALPTVSSSIPSTPVPDSPPAAMVLYQPKN